MKRAHFLLAAGAFAAYPAAAKASAYDRVEAIARAVPGIVGVYCRTLAAGPPVLAFNENEVFPAASTIKMLILVTAFVEEERHPGTLRHRITTHSADVIGGSDFMSEQPDGARFTVYELLVPMITVSDNTASNYLISYFGMPRINAVGARLGMSRTRLARHFLDFAAIVEHNDNVTTPSDMARLLYAIARGSREEIRTIVSPEHCRAMIDIMLRQTDNNKIPVGLPPGVPVAHKTGALDGSRSDVAIVEPFGDSPYILTVYSKWLEDLEPVYPAFHELAALSYRLVGRTDL
ncbi:MAG TPA: serine hydrolase [Candidatus Baltobacteraceae bacterium]|nr:serine hydrolase [Candidatus Baltobacteraceae bacterium]